MIRIQKDNSLPGPCDAVQLDLSCLMDGELDNGTLRRVLVHLEVCPRCRGFFNDLRRQVRGHRAAWRMMTGVMGQSVSDETDRAGQAEGITRKLSQVFYELGKAYVLVSTSPSFRREVFSEPLPILSCKSRGRELLNDYLGNRRFQEMREKRWAEVRNLLRGRLGDGDENLSKGIRILEESLELNGENYHARIYLGHARGLASDHESACEEFRTVLRESRQNLQRGFALENLGNTYLQMGELEDAARCFRRVVHGDILQHEPRFFTSWFNLGLTYGLQGKINMSMGCFQELHDNYSMKQHEVRKIFSAHKQISSLMTTDAIFKHQLREVCPGFFATR